MKYLSVMLFIAAISCSLKSIQKNNDDLKELISNSSPVFIENKVFDEDIDITQLLTQNMISEGVYQVQTQSSITFKNCTFKGKFIAFKKENDTKIISSIFLSNLSFLQCNFNDEVSFRNCSILGRTDFTNSSFKKKTSFEECTFYQNAFFNGCNFNDELRFQNAFFLKKANFMNTKFDTVASFQNSVFNSELQFNAAKFYGYADFSLINCKEHSFFNYTDFQKRSDFSNSSFTGSTNFVKTLFEQSSFDNCIFFGNASYNESQVATRISFANCFFWQGIPDFTSIAKERISISVKNRQ